MSRNYKVSGKKLQQQFDNYVPPYETFASARAEAAAMGYKMPTHCGPNWRRRLKALKKYDNSVPGAGSFERRVIRQEQREVIAKIDDELWRNACG